MSIKPPFTAVEVRRAASGFYEGHSVEIALLSKGIMVALVIWALVWPANANSNLSSLNWSLLEGFNAFYIIIVGLFAFFLAVVAILPQTGKRKMGRADEAPEFSNFPWFSMMFGAGWGLAGLCPGPSLASLSYGGVGHWVFFAAMLAGMAIAPRLSLRLDRFVRAT